MGGFRILGLGVLGFRVGGDYDLGGFRQLGSRVAKVVGFWFGLVIGFGMV